MRKLRCDPYNLFRRVRNRVTGRSSRYRFRRDAKSRSSFKSSSLWSWYNYREVKRNGEIEKCILGVIVIVLNLTVALLIGKNLSLFLTFAVIYALTRSMYCWTSSSAVAPSSSSSSSSSSFCPSPDNCNCLLAQLLTPTVRNALEYQQRIILAIYKYTTDHTNQFYVCWKRLR